MKKLYILSVFLISSLLPFNAALSQSAADLMPEGFPSVSIFSQTITEPGEDPEAGPDVTITVNEMFPTQSLQEIRFFSVERTEPGIGSQFSEFTAIGDTLHTTIADVIDFGIIEDLGFDFDLDFLDRADFVRLSVEENESWQIAEEVLTVEIPEEIFELLPDEFNFDDEMDISITVYNVRLPDAEVETPYGTFDTVVFKPSVDVIVTIYVILPIVGAVPVNIPVVDEYGIEIYYAQGYGIVKEHLEPTIFRITIPLADFSQDLAEVPGRTLLLREFEIQSDSSAEDFEERPSVFKLFSNYPNPFNPSTNLRFELNEPGSISISIYDTQGRLVDQAVMSRFFNSGIHTISYDASTLASGQYLYKVQFTAANGNNSFTQSSSFTLIK